MGSDLPSSRGGGECTNSVFELVIEQVQEIELLGARFWYSCQALKWAVETKYKPLVTMLFERGAGIKSPDQKFRECGNSQCSKLWGQEYSQIFHRERGRY